MQELRYIILMDEEGAKLYLDGKSPDLRKSLFESLVDRKSRTYQYYGSSNKTPFIEVEEGTEGGLVDEVLFYGTGFC